ncbi:hypothetical protein [Streptomyces sp. NPDC059874]|uniref:hypothetical protein n=1 Tax=Streptomyces sp. NPDC059874 TaxID=3346983 RepID=UPI0036548B2D
MAGRGRRHPGGRPYPTGRAAMAFELGHFQVAERELRRLREPEDRYDDSDAR